MGLEIQEPNTCIRGCCRSSKIPLHLSPSSFTLGAPIAKGAESVVYEARLDGKAVAVKKPVLSSSDHLDKFHKELQLLCKLDHPGLATLVAAHAKPPNYMFFFPLYEKQSLSDKLHVEEWTPTIDQVLTITFQLAKALQYLHKLGILHRDVKPANILLDKNLWPHLADFGLAEYKEDLKLVSVHNWRSTGKPTGGFHKKNMVGTLIYMAPEVLRKELHTEKSDVYSFGVSINELLTGVVPYTDLRAAAQAHTVLEMNYTEQQLTAAVVSEGLRPVPAGLETGAPENLLSLIQKCWDSDCQKRPSFGDITEELEHILEQRIKLQNLSQLSSSPDDQDVGYANDFRSFHESINWYTLGQHVNFGAPQATDCDGKIWSDTSNDPMAYCPVLSWGSFATCGKRESMEDTHFLIPQFSNEKDIHMFGIFDGHRGGTNYDPADIKVEDLCYLENRNAISVHAGAAAAEFSARALPGILQNLGSRSSPSEALSEAFVETDKSFRDELDTLRKSKRVIQKNWHPGCTAVVALLVRNKLFVANAGDCRAILCRSGHPIALSKDHVASCPEERERIISAGESVKWQVDTWRVGSAALQVTRSIGDDDLKPAVTAEPEISEKILSSEDEYLVLASDGLWDVISNAEVVSIIRDTVKEPGMCSKRLATEAAERGSKDNITVIVVFLRPVSTAERIY